jgi:RNA polymerase sigma factor (sigma-70 family)
MTDGRWGGVLHHLRRTALRHEAGGLSDGQLLERFLARRDEAAFEALVRRHGPMVLGVCRRILSNDHDAEDAFQAAFLVLVRKAASVQPRELVGNWLYGVAHRTALEARGVRARRRMREKQVSAMPDWATPSAPQNELTLDLRPLLDEELNRLPDKYRTPVVLCDLEGRSRKEVARALRIPEGTLSSRLATARRLLAQRLSLRGLGVSAVALTAFLAQQTAIATVPASLIAVTTHAATLFAAGSSAAGAISLHVIHLTEGVLKAMFLAKLKTMTAVLVLMAILGGGLGLVGHASWAGPPDESKPGQAKPTDPKKKGGGPVKVDIVQNRDVEKKLQAATNVNFENVPLGDVLAELRDTAGLNIVVDRTALAEANIALSQPITLRLDGITRKTVLKYVLRDAGGLVFRVEDGVLVITTNVTDQVKKTRRVYAVADLVGKSDNAEDLIRVIRNTVGTLHDWTYRKGDEDNGLSSLDGGTIEYFAEGKSLVINQTSDIQSQIEELLNDLRITVEKQKMTDKLRGAEPPAKNSN